MYGTFEVICYICGADLTLAEEHWDNKSILRPLVAIEVMPCTNCMSRAASEAAEYGANCMKIAEIEMSREGENHE